MQRGWIRDATVLESRSLSACSFQLWFPNPFGTTDWLPGRQFFHRPGEEVEWFGDDSSALHLLGSLFLLLLYRLHLTSSGIRSWKLGIPDLAEMTRKARMVGCAPLNISATLCDGRHAGNFSFSVCRSICTDISKSHELSGTWKAREEKNEGQWEAPP